MYKGMNAKEFMNWAEERFTNNLDFTIHMVEYVKPKNPVLFEEVINLIKANSQYKLKFLDYAGRS